MTQSTIRREFLPSDLGSGNGIPIPSAEPPANPTAGTLWYRISDCRTFQYNASNAWEQVAGVTTKRLTGDFSTTIGETILQTINAGGLNDPTYYTIDGGTVA